MNKKTYLMLSMALMLLTGYAWSEIVVDLKASDLAAGTTREWLNKGTAGGKFSLVAGDVDAVVETIDGKPCVTFTPNQSFKSDFLAPASVTGANAWTMAALVRSPRYGNQTYFTWARRGVGNGGAQCMFWDDATYGAMNHYGGGIGWGAAAPSLNQWHLLTVTFSGAGAGNIENAYIDGQLVSSKTLALVLQTDSSLFVGSRVENDNSTRGAFFQGSVSSLQLYNEELTPAQVAQLAGRFQGVSISPWAGTVEEGGATVALTVALGASPSGGPTQPVSVTLTPADAGGDIKLSGATGAGQPVTVTFTSANWNTPQTVKITAIDDVLIEPDEFVNIAVAFSTTDPVYSGMTYSPLSIAITIKDNERTDNPVPTVYKGGFLFDDYEIARDYLKYGVSNTPYDGALNTQNAVTKTDASVTTAGSLHLESYNANWGDNNNSGPFLYKNVSGDFIADTFVSGYAGTVDVPVYHNACGLQVRLPDTSNGENNLQCSYFPIWGCGNIIWYNVNGGRTETDNLGTAFDGDKYLRIERRGPLFYCSHSPDGTTWKEFPSSPFRLDNMNVETLQVGFYQATYNTTTGWAEFGYLNLKSPTGSISGTLDLYEALESTGNLQVALTPPAGFPAPLSDIVVTLTPLAVSGAGADANDIKLGTAEKGQPITVTFAKANWNQPQTVKVQAIKDTFDEGIQVMSVQYSVNSNDPNWNGAMFNNTALIKVYDGNPGIVLTETGGDTQVYEGGASDTIEIALQSSPTADVTVDISDGDTINPQATFTPAQLVFTATNWSQKQSVTVTAIDDAVMEGDPHWDFFKIVANNGSEYNSTDTVIPETWFQIHDNECGAWSTLWADFNGDCIVNLQDFALFCQEWMKCTRPNDPGCVDLR